MIKSFCTALPADGLALSFLLIICFLEAYWHAASQPLFRRSGAAVQWCNGRPYSIASGNGNPCFGTRYSCGRAAMSTPPSIHIHLSSEVRSCYIEYCTVLLIVAPLPGSNLQYFIHCGPRIGSSPRTSIFIRHFLACLISPVFTFQHTVLHLGILFLRDRKG
jgi:hypothetical protein